MPTLPLALHDLPQALPPGLAQIEGLESGVIQERAQASPLASHDSQPALLQAPTRAAAMVLEVSIGLALASSLEKALGSSQGRAPEGSKADRKTALALAQNDPQERAPALPQA